MILSMISEMSILNVWISRAGLSTAMRRRILHNEANMSGREPVSLTFRHRASSI